MNWRYPLICLFNLFLGSLVRKCCIGQYLHGSLTTSSQVTRSNVSNTALCLAKYLSLYCFFLRPKIEQLTVKSHICLPIKFVRRLRILSQYKFLQYTKSLNYNQETKYQVKTHKIKIIISFKVSQLYKHYTQT